MHADGTNGTMTEVEMLLMRITSGSASLSGSTFRRGDGDALALGEQDGTLKSLSRSSRTDADEYFLRHRVLIPQGDSIVIDHRPQRSTPSELLLEAGQDARIVLGLEPVPPRRSPACPRIRTDLEIRRCCARYGRSRPLTCRSETERGVARDDQENPRPLWR